MAIFKCKMCGGTLEITAGTSVIECEYCGVTQTLPKLDDDRRANMYDRANHFRRNNDYDKAMGIFEQILNDDNTDAEAYWSLVLCRYGIEYVEDPATRKRVPTVNRAQFTSIFADEDYKSALQYADEYQRSVYEAEAKAIDEIQKGILAISQKEEPFDVFICYKETDNNGRRTQDSVLANDLYHQLTQEGFKVFFSRITLEDKLGTAYEPYIFAALNSSKVMVVLGTRPEYFNAVWVKNEWSRYLALIRGGAKKILIPAYRDMDPYDLPEEFSHLQAQDMGKLGFMQDLIRGIKKLTQEEAPKTTVVKETVTVNANASTAPLLKRAFMFLEDGEWNSANEYCEKVLDIDPECAEAYIGKLMVDLKIAKRELLKDCEKPFDDNNNYKKALRFGDESLSNELTEACYSNWYSRARDAMSTNTESSLNKAITMFESISNYKDSEQLAEECKLLLKDLKRELIYKKAVMKKATANASYHYKEAAVIFKTIPGYKDADQLYEFCINKEEELRLESTYSSAKFSMNTARSAAKYEEAAKAFASISGYKDANEMYNFCLEQAENARKDKIYNDACQKLETNQNNKSHLLDAAKMFRSISGYKDADQKEAECKNILEEIERKSEEEHIKAEKKKKKQKTITTIILSIIVIALIAIALIVGVVIPNVKYNDAVALMEAGNIAEAFNIFRTLDDYKDSYNHTCECILNLGFTPTSISAGSSHTVGLKSDGTVVAVGYNDDGECDVDDWTDIVAVSASFRHTVGLKSDGTVVAVGENGYGRCDVDAWTDIVAISAGDSHTVGLKADGTVVAVGGSGYGQCDVYRWSDIVAISAGACCTIGLKADGTVVAVGYNQYGRCNVDGWSDIVAISAGDSHTVGLKADGTVVAVGDNDDGQCDVYKWADIVAISAGYQHTVGLKSDGTVVAVGSTRFGKCEVDSWSNIMVVAK